MASGRTPEVAKRNKHIKRRYANGEQPHALAKRYGVTRQTIHKVIADPDSHKVTVREPTVLVRPLSTPTSKKYRGITHGSEAGYREELRRGLTTCDDCREAHALVIATVRNT